jgi:Phage protein Gp138 N-terminal domain
MSTERNPSATAMHEVIQRDLQKRIRTIVPATVVSYNPATQSAAVQPAPMALYRGATNVPEPIAQVADAPVAFPSGGGMTITWALLPGDPVLLLVSDRDIDRWRLSGSPYPPSTSRMHEVTDCFVWPGAGPAPDPATGASATDLQIHTAAGVVLRITPAGTVHLGAGALAPAGNLALAQSLHTYLVAAITAAVPVALDGGAGLKASLLAYLGSNPYTAFATANTVAT